MSANNIQFYHIHTSWPVKIIGRDQSETVISVPRTVETLFRDEQTCIIRDQSIPSASDSWMNGHQEIQIEVPKRSHHHFEITSFAKTQISLKDFEAEDLHILMDGGQLLLRSVNFKRIFMDLSSAQLNAHLSASMLDYQLSYEIGKDSNLEMESSESGIITPSSTKEPFTLKLNNSYAQMVFQGKSR